MVKKVIFLVVTIISAIFAFSTFIPGIYIPTDNLNYLPNFSQHSWVKPHNSLLSDPLYQFEPWRHYAKERITSGEFPFWNDLVAGGIPFFSNPQSAVFFPIHFFYYILPLKIASWFIPLFKIFLFGFFSYLYLKSLKISFSIRLVAMMAIVFSAFFMEWLLWPHTSVFLFFPLLLFLAEKMADGNYLKHRLLLAIAISYFLSILGGHPGTTVHLSIIYFIYITARFWNNKRVILHILAALLLGATLASFILVPWIEFMINSSQYYQRFFSVSAIKIPFFSLSTMFIPFILGAPHQIFYKQISSIYNYQELTAGYVAPAVILGVVIGTFFFRNKVHIKIWLLLVAISYLIGLNIFPFSEIGKIPPLNGISNLRLISFGSFGMAMLFALILEEFKNSKYKLKKTAINKILITSFILTGFIFLIDKIISINLISQQSQKILDFYPFLRHHLYLLFFSTLLFFGVLIYVMTLKNRKKYPILYVFLSFPLFFQYLFLFWNYNSINPKDSYYSKTELIKTLQKLQKEPVLDVGNPNIPPNINMIYGIKSAENDYALSIYSYQTEFDKVFPIKNHWNKVDSVSQQSIKRLGIKYVVSDYNINFLKVADQDKIEEIFPLVNKKDLYSEFVAHSTNLSQIRLLTANYNRLNFCSITIVLSDEYENKLTERKVPCRDIRDKMFYTIDFESVLNYGKKYRLTLKATSTSERDYVGLWGNKDGKIYLQTLYNDKPNKFPLIWENKGLYLFESKDSKYITFPGKYKVLKENPENILISVSSDRAVPFEIKKVSYPGWRLFINGIEKKTLNGLFLTAMIPPGDNIVEFKYVPLTFYIGLLFSYLAFVLSLVYVLRKERKQKYFINFSNSTKGKFLHLKIPWHKHLFIVLISFFINLVLISFIIHLLPIKFVPSESTAINWFTLNNYPRQQDYFYFFCWFVYLLISTFIFWFIWVLKKYY